jgi:DnaJ like chaperone protein
VVLGAVLYFIVPWDFDFVPVAGRVDDLILLGLALMYAWKQKKARVGADPGRAGAEGGRTGDGAGAEDPYTVLGVGRDASEEEIKAAYRELLGKYHPDRVQHLGEEFREMASRKAVSLNRAYERIKAEKHFS